jgi:hypothetical protein
VRTLIARCLAVLVAVPLLAQPQTRPAILSRLTWFDRAGTRLGGIGPVADHGNLELSPDGSRVAVAVTDHAHDTRDIWVYDSKTGDRTQFTSEPTDENWMIWSGDGSRVILNSFAMDHLDLFEAPSKSLEPHTTLMKDGVGEMAGQLVARWPVRASTSPTRGPRATTSGCCR